MQHHRHHGLVGGRRGAEKYKQHELVCQIKSHGRGPSSSRGSSWAGHECWNRLGRHESAAITAAVVEAGDGRAAET